MQKCPVCSAIFPPTQFVCAYCGYVETERFKKIDNQTVLKLSFDERMNVIQENLNAIHAIPKPTIGNNFLQIVYYLLAVQTFGISLIFWKKPKSKFNAKEFNKLKALIARNIELLKHKPY